MTPAVPIDVIRARLQRVFAPTTLEVLDEGHLHKGHPGDGQGHFRVRIASPAFAGKTRIQQHQMVYGVFNDLLGGHGIHALAIEVLPDPGRGVA